MSEVTSDTVHEERLRALVNADGPVAVGDALALFDALPPVGLEELVGDWDGGVVLTGHRGERQLDRVRWAGKRFGGPEDVDPMVCLDESGARVASDMMGDARLRMVEFRGVVTATMIYDRHPILDHFRRVSREIVLGVMDTKGDDAPLFFFLRRRA